MHALICDDFAGTRLLMKQLIVRNLGWTVAECADGAAALERLAHEHFDVAILDIDMPELNGIKVVEAIRASPHLSDLPIVMLTSDHREEMVRYLRALGVTDYIVKPPNVKNTISKLQRIEQSRQP